MRRATILAATVLTAAVATAWLAPNVWAYEFQRTSEGAVVKWSSFPVPYVLSATPARITPPLTNTEVFNTLREAVATWETKAPLMQARFVEDTRVSPDQTGRFNIDQDRRNVITFATSDPELYALIPPGVVGLTTVYVDDDTLSWETGQTGRITEADIFLNNIDYIFVLDAPTGTPTFFSVNLRELATHQFGEFIGASQSFLRTPITAPLPLSLETGGVLVRGLSEVEDSPIMFPFYGSRGTKVSDFIRQDDIAAVSALYPRAAFFTTYGTVEGRVTDIRTGSPVFGAHVVLLEVADPVLDPTAALRNPVVSALTLPDGNFRVQGVPAGRYFLLVEPSNPRNLGNFYNDASVPVDRDFAPTFYRTTRQIYDAQVITVAAGQTVRNIQVEVLKAFTADAELEPNDTPTLARPMRSGKDQVTAVIDPEGDLDAFRFFANRGDLVRIEVKAARLRSQLDPVLRVYDGLSLRVGGGQLGRFENVEPMAMVDDSLGIAPDAFMDVRIPHSGTFYVTVVDKFGRGGADYWYELSIQLLSHQIALRPMGPRTAVLGLDISAEAVAPVPAQAFDLYNLKTLTVRFETDDASRLSYAPDDPTVRDMFLGLSMGNDSGVALYRNTGKSIDQFDFVPGDARSSDALVRLRSMPRVVQGRNRFDVVFDLTSDELIPMTKDGGKVDYWVVVRPSIDLYHGDNFRVTIPTGGAELVNLTRNRTLTVFDQPVPTYPNTYLGEIVEMVSLMQPFQRIDAQSAPTAVIGLNVLGAPSQDYFIRQVELTIVGFNGKQLANEPFASFISPFIARAPDIFRVPAAERNRENLSIDDFERLRLNGLGGFALYRDSVDPQGTDGRFDSRLDIALPLASASDDTLGPRFEPLPASEIPEEFVRRVLPEFLEQRLPLRMLTRLPLTAFKVVLPLDLSSEGLGLLEVPSTDSAAFNTEGSDFFVVIRTSALMRALDVFVPMLFVGDITVQAGRRLPDIDRPDPMPSMASMDPTTVPGSQQIVCRPRPVFAVSDLVGSGAQLGLDNEGNPPLAVLGINASDRGQNMFNFFINTMFVDARTAMQYFNSSPVLTDMLLRIVPEPEVEITAQRPFQPLAPLFSFYNVDDSLRLLSNGLQVWVDDDTDQGNNLDDDGDGLIDEELWNLQDDDLDGRIDEDLGDRDGTLTNPGLPKSGNGVWDLQFDHTWPPIFDDWQNPELLTVNLSFADVRMFLPEDRFAQATNALTGVTTYRIPFGAQIANEIGGNYALVNPQPLFSPGLLNDPQTQASSFIFARTGQRPVSGLVAHPVKTGGGTLTNLAEASGGADYRDLWQHGVRYRAVNTQGPMPQVLYPHPLNNITLLQAVNALDDGSYPFSLTYDFQLEIPDDDSGPLAGDDFFIVLRAGPGAQGRLGDKFRVVLGAINTRVYQDVQSRSLQAFTFPESATFEFASGPIRIGRGSFPPTITITSPSINRVDNRVDASNRFVVTWEADDPDSTAFISLYLDDDPRGYDGILIKKNLNEDKDKSFVLDFSVLIPQLRLDPRRAYYVYAVIEDENEQFSTYSSAPIVLWQSLRSSFGYLKLADSGQVYVFYELDEFGIGDDHSRDRFRRFPTPVTGMGLDIEATFGSDGILLLNKNGTVFGYGEIGQYFPDGKVWQADNLIDGYRLLGPTASEFMLGFALGDDAPVDLAVDWNRGVYYILSRAGQLAAYGATSSATTPLVTALSKAWIPRGFDYVDMELSPGGNGLYLLDAGGRVQAYGDADAVLARSVTRQILPGEPRLVDLEVTQDGRGLLVMNELGRLIRAGNAPALSDQEFERLAAFLTDGRSDTAKSIKVLRGDLGLEGYIAMSRAGRVTVEPPMLVDLPLDDVIVYNGMQDIEPSAVSNITTIASAVVELYEAFRREDFNAVMGMTSLRYRDDHGNDYNQFRKTLRNYFDSFEIVNFSIGPNVPQPDLRNPEAALPDIGFSTDTVRNRVEVMFRGERVITNVETSIHYRVPTMTILQLPVDVAEVGQTFTFGYPFAPLDPADQTGFPYPQTNEIREIRDGRGWLFEIYDINDVGNFAISTPQDLDGIEGDVDIFSYLTRRNERIFATTFNRGLDGPWRIHFKAHGPRVFDGYLLVFLQYAASNAFGPPDLDFLTFDTQQILTTVGTYAFEATHEFQWEKGQLKLTKFDLYWPQMGPQEVPTGLINGGQRLETVEAPLGFNAKERMFVRNRFINDLAFRVSGTSLIVDCQRGGIANLTLLPVVTPSGLPLNVDTMDWTPDDLELTRQDRLALADWIRRTITRNMLRTMPPGQDGIPPYSADFGEGLPGDVFLILDCDDNHYWLLRVVGAIGDLFIYDWHVFPEFTLDPAVAP